MNTTTIATPHAPAAIGPYSQAVVTPAGVIYTAGQIALVPETGQLAGQDIAVQTRRVLENIRAILQAAGSDMNHVVKTTVFLKDMGEFAAMNEVYAEFFHQTLPARSTVEVARLPRDVRVEIEAVAVVTQP
jgi:2-iminobutanoate/2-iminopropanoate deaminase